ncbi:MAG: twin-arginine translocase TatA/TatE family subunit [Leptospiraceae bacterium]|nr:twin-arginine translocase TatA/TatE family subunit [Leptospiraceae bacterium]
MAPLFIQNFGLPEWTIVLVLVLLLFGGRKIPQLAKDLGSGIREFRKSLGGSSSTAELEEPGDQENSKTKRKTKSKAKS